MQKLASKIAAVYLTHGINSARNEFESVCSRRNLYGWSRLFLSAQVKIFLKQNYPERFPDFMRDLKR